MSEEQSKLKASFSQLGGYLLYKSTQMKDMYIHLERLVYQSTILAADN